MVTKVVHAILKRRCCVACRCALKKKHNIVKIIGKARQGKARQGKARLYAKLEGNTNGINKPHADESRARDFEKEMCPCVDVP